MPSNGGNKTGHLFNKWAAENDVATSPKFTPNQITFATATTTGKKQTPGVVRELANGSSRQGGRKQNGGAQTSDLTMPQNVVSSKQPS